MPVVAVGSYLLPLIGLFIGASGGAGEGGSADADGKRFLWVHVRCRVDRSIRRFNRHSSTYNQNHTQPRQ